MAKHRVDHKLETLTVFSDRSLIGHRDVETPEVCSNARLTSYFIGLTEKRLLLPMGKLSRMGVD